MGAGISAILPGLYVGSFRDMRNKEEIDKLGISHILAVHDTAKQLYQDKQYLCIHASDSLDQDLKSFFSRTNTFIHEARVNNGKVVVHCLAGMSRSVTIVIAYIMSISELSWRDAFHVVFMQRKSARPNMSFQRQLGEFERSGMEEERQRLLNIGQSPFHKEECKVYQQALRDWDKWVRFGDSQITQAHLSNEYSLEPDQYTGKTKTGLKQEDVEPDESKTSRNFAASSCESCEQSAQQRCCKNINFQNAATCKETDGASCAPNRVISCRDTPCKSGSGEDVHRSATGEKSTKTQRTCLSEFESQSSHSSVKTDAVEEIFERNFKLDRK